MNNEPVAWWDGKEPNVLGLAYHQNDYCHFPLYTHPVKEFNDGGEPVKNATYWKRQHDNLLMKLNTCAVKVSELEKKLDTRTKELIGASFYEHDYKTLMANNEPVAWMSEFGQFIGKVQDEICHIPLYTHPAKEKGLPRSNPLPMNQAYLTRSDDYTPIAWSCWSEGMQAAIITTTEPDMYGWQSIIPLFSHPAKTLDRELLDKTIIDQQNEIKELRKNLDVALMIVNEPAKTLTDEEINELYVDYQNPDYYSREVIFDQLGFARAILRKAQE